MKNFDFHRFSWFFNDLCVIVQMPGFFIVKGFLGTCGDVWRKMFIFAPRYGTRTEIEN